MSATQSWFGPLAEKSRFTRSGAGRLVLSLRVVKALFRWLTAEARRLHQPSHVLARHMEPPCRQLSVDPWRAVRSVRTCMDLRDALQQGSVRDGADSLRCRQAEYPLGEMPSSRHIILTGTTAWFSFTNWNLSVVPPRSPGRIRPRLLPRSRVPSSNVRSFDAGLPGFFAPSWSGRRLADPRQDRPPGPSS